jgi:UDP-3-O-[3-hydroxymyristoyl] N-acetylglucosamine deacetylase
MPGTTQDQGIGQRTLDTEFRVYGKGMHTGQPVCMTVYSGEPDTGICFLRADQPPSRALILARWSSVVSTQYSTDIGNNAGVHVRAVGRLLAALRLGGVDNALVVLNGPEIPALDGSAAAFLIEIERAGTVEQDAPARTIVLRHPVQVREGHRYVRLSPSLNPRLTITIASPGTAMGMQSLGAAWNQDFLKREIAPARIFGFAAEHARANDRSHAPGIHVIKPQVVHGAETQISGEMRHPDEFVRHKLLDAIGDLYLAGWPLRANYDGFMPCHALNVRLLRKVFEQNSDAWTLVPTRARRRVESEEAAGLL